jgi:signal transduction histidine kinase
MNKPDPQLLRSLLEGIEEGVANVRPDGAILYANRKFTQLFGADGRARAVGSCLLRDLIDPASWRDLDRGLQAAMQRPMDGTVRIWDWKQNVMRTLRLSLSPVRGKKGTTIKVTAAETTELLEKNRELQDKEASLHALSARILQLQDEERRRIARDLHDITGQELAVAIMSMMQLMKCERADEIREKIADATGLVRKVEEEIRTLSYVLHPPLLDEFGLASALNWYAEGFMKRSGIQTELECPADLPRLDPEKEMALFRVVQEGLTNVLRHSGSEKARICVSFDAEFVVLSLEDEGRGIDRKKIAKMSNTIGSGVGVAGMRERMQQFGGRLEIRPREKGTQLTAMVPIGHVPANADAPSEEDILKTAHDLGYKEEPHKATAARPANARKRILIADDHEVTRHGIRKLFENEENIEICAEAKDGLEAIDQARELDPDLVIMDLTMPHTGGFAAAHRIRESGMRARILFFTNHTSPELELLSKRKGFEGLVQKADGARDLVRGVQAVLSGKKFFGGAVWADAPAPDEGARGSRLNGTDRSLRARA